MAADVIELKDAAWRRHDFYMRLAMVVEFGREVPRLARRGRHRPRRPRPRERLQRHAGRLSQLHRRRTWLPPLRTPRRAARCRALRPALRHLPVRPRRAERNGHRRAVRHRDRRGDALHHSPAVLQLPQGADADPAPRRRLPPRVAGRSSRLRLGRRPSTRDLVGHYRSKGNVFARLARSRRWRPSSWTSDTRSSTGR